ncbi:hypothetical protein BDY19DRAFT_991469 [Irpex rosettiformis]|uniref:Uncharacterized protein n=1 Tax=Irpex rosettiformis TaxID=378272 RepID=A0ACB8UC36_9APHY|nr:hypothetical protein BDY19DRAFT_991469 [Irpex rosettiformis]
MKSLSFFASLAAFVADVFRVVALPSGLTSTDQSITSSCQCTAGNIPVALDVDLPLDPTDDPINSTNTRNLRATFGIHTIFCQPPHTATRSSQDHVQLLLHGSTYTSQYWTWPFNGFQNYSYVAHACAEGHITVAYDALGVGLSDRPSNSADIQLPSAAAIAAFFSHHLKSGELTTSLGLPTQRFKRVIAIGHSQGSVVYNYASIFQGSKTPFDALILTGHLHDPGFLESTKFGRPAARDVDPGRWANLDPGYISSSNRTQYYPPDNSTFSADIVKLDQLTKDVSTVYYTDAAFAVYVPAKGFKGPVVQLVGSEDQVHCLNGGDGFVSCNAKVLQASEEAFWPDSKNFTMVVRQGQGHDVNLDFGAAETFSLLTELVEQFTH